MSPTGACFKVGPRNYFRFARSLEPIRTATAYAIISGFFEKSVVYDSLGKKWIAVGLDAPFKKTWWRVVLTHTIYNPRVSVRVRWSPPVEYALAELKEVYAQAVDRDDDILTQFIETADLKEKIAGAASFAELAHIYELGRNEATERKSA